ncbi:MULTISPECIES: hypothetical protein [Bacillus cereus group]|uniref:hypothetical protein n=1 Tax=Bacillus cereus group TaxID=86661 RepID=UPI000D038187|nr:hypothetical protein [Bacillus toyonensis]PRT10573.1 hypothetical protein C6353_31230 [Bacillus toyonensis]
MAGCVNLCIYICPGANVANGRVDKDVQIAQVWNKCGIKFLIKHQERTSDDGYFQYTDHEIQFNGGDPTNAPEKMKKLFSYRPECDPEDIAIYYVNGDTFHNGVTGGSYFGNNPILTPTKQYSIILTNNANHDVLAHEIGHLLFTRLEGSNYVNHDPNPDPNDLQHDNNLCNLMFRNFTSTDITTAQCELANRSELVKECPPPPPPPNVETRRRIEISGNMHILDDEISPDSDVSTDRPLGSITNPKVIPLSLTTPFHTFTWTEKFGGEIRVEARFDLILKSDLSVDITYDVLLFEGASEDTGDLDGRKTITIPINVPVNGNKIIDFTVNNDKEGSDDKAIIHLDIFNKQ